MAAKGILPPTLKMILRKHYPLPVRQSPVLPHPEIPSPSSSLPCTEPESSGEDQTESDSLGAPVDGPREEQSETPLAVEPDDRTGKHRDGEQIQLERGQSSEGEGRLMPERAFLAPKKHRLVQGWTIPESSINGRRRGTREESRK